LHSSTFTQDSNEGKPHNSKAIKPKVATLEGQISEKTVLNNGYICNMAIRGQKNDNGYTMTVTMVCSDEILLIFKCTKRNLLLKNNI